MPGKVNPVIPEVISQVAFRIIGFDVTIAMAAEAGQLELNAFEPVVFDSLFQSIDQMGNAVDTLIDNCIVGITANEDHCREMVNNSIGTVTALCPHIGYTEAADIAKEALKTHIPVSRLVVEKGILSEEELAVIMDPYEMTKPGISGKELLHKG